VVSAHHIVKRLSISRRSPDLVMQTFHLQQRFGRPRVLAQVYEDARVKSPTFARGFMASGISDAKRERTGFDVWETRNRALMRIYMAHALNFNAATRGRKTEVIPGGLALINLKQAFDAGKVPGLTNFFATNFGDDLHLSEAGRQFIGMVIFSHLYNRSPVGLPIVKIGDQAPELTPEQNRVYQQIAWDTVQSFKKDNGASLAFAVPGEIDALAFIRGEVPCVIRAWETLMRIAAFNILNAARAGKYDSKSAP
jgi:hypothetical protein